MKLSEAFDVSVNTSSVSLSSLSSNDVILLEQAFAKFIDSGLAALSCVLVPQTDTVNKKMINVSEDVAADFIKSTGIVKSILALRNNKSVAKEQTIVTVLARVALGRLQNPGDRFEIDFEKFTIGFQVVDSVKPDYDWEGIKKEAGASVSSEIINTELAGCFKAPSLPGNPSGANQAITDGKLDSKYKTDKVSVDVVVDFAWKTAQKGE